MYVAVKGGEKAIRAAHALQEQKRRGDGRLPELSVEQIGDQLSLAVDRVMTEGGIADRELAALALKQASGDNVEAIFLLRAYRTTLPRLAVSEPINTAEMRLERRISAVYKDIPGGQLLGPTYDYTHRLLDFTLLANGEAPSVQQADGEAEPTPHVFSLLTQQGLAKTEEDRGTPPDDITRTPPVYPCSRSSRLQQLMRGDEGYLLALAYSTHRLLDFTLLANGEAPSVQQADGEAEPTPHVFSLLTQQGLAKTEEDRGTPPDDITRTPPVYPCSRSSRLQQLMRGDEGYLLALAYSTQRGYGRNHPFAGEIRSGYVQVEIVPEELGFSVNIGELLLTECEMVNGFVAPQEEPPHFTRGYGLTFGMSERKAMAMALVDRALQAPDYDEEIAGPAQDEEFVLAHADNVEAAGFVSHLKLPHYVDFQAELALLKRLQRENERG